MFDWLEDLLEALGELLGDAFQEIGESVAAAMNSDTLPSPHFLK